MKAGDLDKAEEGISDRFLEELTAIGSAEEVREGVERYRRGRRDVTLHRPDAPHRLRATLEATAPTRTAA